MRGKAAHLCEWWSQSGITPAYAGKRVLFMSCKDNCGDHRRGCGEKRSARLSWSIARGSPPRMRGKGPIPKQSRIPRGITPAYAGKSSLPSGCPSSGPDHPRVCGEKKAQYIIDAIGKGSPPRMRGKAKYASKPADYIRITPAYAGKSSLPNG